MQQELLLYVGDRFDSLSWPWMNAVCRGRRETDECCGGRPRMGSDKPRGENAAQMIKADDRWLEWPGQLVSRCEKAVRIATCAWYRTRMDDGTARG